LEKEDFEIPGQLEKLARSASSKDTLVSIEEFKRKFEPVVIELRGGL